WNKEFLANLHVVNSWRPWGQSTRPQLVLGRPSRVRVLLLPAMSRLVRSISAHFPRGVCRVCTILTIEKARPRETRGRAFGLESCERFTSSRELPTVRCERSHHHRAL